MFNRLFFIVLFISCLLLHGNNALAGDIEQGTHTLGASSSTHLSWHEYQDNNGSEDIYGYDLSLAYGYFCLKNVEVGSALSFSYHESQDYHSVGFGFAPYLTYHIPLTLKSNLYTTLGAGYGRSDYSADSSRDGQRSYQSVFAEVGYEYFLSDRVAVAWGLKGDRETVDYSDCEECSYTRNLIATQLKFKLFF